MITVVLFFHLLSIFSFALIEAAASNDFECVGVSGLNPENDPIYDPITKTWSPVSVPDIWSLSKSTDSQGAFPPQPNHFSSHYNTNGASASTLSGSFKYWNFLIGPAHSQNSSIGFLSHLSEFKDIIHHYNLKSFNSTYTMVSYLHSNSIHYNFYIHRSLVIIFNCRKQFLDKKLGILSEILEPKLVEEFILAVTVRFNAVSPDHAQIRIAVKSSYTAHYLRNELVNAFDNILQIKNYRNLYDS